MSVPEWCNRTQEPLSMAIRPQSQHTPQDVCAASQVKMCLVINKIDRLVLETRLTPSEAYERLKVRVSLNPSPRLHPLLCSIPSWALAR